MRYIKPVVALLLVLCALVACQTVQDPEKMAALSDKILTLQEQIDTIQESGGEVPPELMTALSDLIQQLAENEGRGDDLPFDVAGTGASAAILLGLYNQIFGSRRSKRLERDRAA